MLSCQMRSISCKAALVQSIASNANPPTIRPLDYKYLWSKRPVEPSLFKWLKVSSLLLYTTTSAYHLQYSAASQEGWVAGCSDRNWHLPSQGLAAECGSPICSTWKRECVKWWGSLWARSHLRCASREQALKKMSSRPRRKGGREIPTSARYQRHRWRS